MDRNQFIGLILMFAVLAVYFWLAPEPVKPEQEAAPTVIADSTGRQEPSPMAATLQPQLPDSIIKAQNEATYGMLAFAVSEAEGDDEIIETEDLRVTFSSKGGSIKEVALLNQKNQSGEPFKLMDAEKSRINIIVDNQGKSIDLTELHYAVSVNKKTDTTQVSYTATNGSIKIEQTYLIPKNGFSIEYDIKTEGLNGVLSPQDIDFQWTHAVNLAERTLKDSRENSNVRYLLSSGEYDELKERSNDYEEATLTSQVKWVSFKQKFFTAAVIADQSFGSGFVNQKVNFDDSSSVKDMSMALTIPYGDFMKGFGMRYYFGTTNYGTLKKVAPEFEENLDMGWGPLPIVNKFLIIPIFTFLQDFISNYGVVIIILVVLIRLMLSPLTYKSHISMAKMRAMKPELDEMKEKHEGDMQKQQQEQMKLYQQVGINPLSGCIPMVLQMPILFSLFFFFPNAVDLRGQSFLWATDLSTYDSIFTFSFDIPFYGDHISLFTILMTITTIGTIWSNGQVSASVQGPMKTMQYMMPIMMLFFLNNYASGLTFYYFISNIATLGQTLLFKKFVDEEKIRKTLEENKKKNATKGKSKFQQRLEDAMKTNQEAQKKKKKRK